MKIVHRCIGLGIRGNTGARLMRLALKGITPRQVTAMKTLGALPHVTSLAPWFYLMLLGAARRSYKLFRIAHCKV